MSKLNGKFLIAVLSRKLEIRLASSIPSHVQGADRDLKLYSDGFIGFYDALRDENKTIIGIRLGVASDEVESLIAGKLPDYVYVEKPSSNSIVEICWGHRANIVEEYSDDQAMGSHGIYWDGGSAIAFYFDVSSFYSDEFLQNDAFTVSAK